MGNQIHTNRIAARFSSNTLSCSRPSGSGTSEDISAVREKLIAAAVEVLAEGGDPRLAESRALA